MARNASPTDDGTDVLPRIARKAASHVLVWYDVNRRVLPWRAASGEKPDPYHVWLSEIMLQQTTVATVGPYFADFVRRWPTVSDLAAAELDDVLHAWQGLGYYARARNLHKCAGIVASQMGGRFPEDEKALKGLPGIGDYTSAAIAAIAFGKGATPVDGNVERVMARLFAVKEPLPGSKPRLRSLAAGLTPAKRAGDYAQALMDLGATVCRPRNPSCDLCPLEGLCRARREGTAARLPARTPRKPQPKRYGVAFWMTNDDGAVFIRRREEKGLLGGMMEFPSTPWRAEEWMVDEAASYAPTPDPGKSGWRILPGSVRHVFTHFDLELQVVAGVCAKGAKRMDGAVWCPVSGLGDHAFPTVMKKIAALAKSLEVD
ncbi:MAG: A/G-specific adenine glycosylase [Rhodospirillales bacterium]|nr:A/G-specific adenine glycosylase [Rhodospirillales bacterium]MCW8862190.1 A/G-specific adenine glycosylase [Rhodospirillales bacterium]MCW9002547.1 A/G-specific adenine glycosylase [Rhodospirillales bacterium]